MKQRKWKRRADDAIQYGFINKALMQYQAIYESARNCGSRIEADSYSMIIKLRTRLYFDENSSNLIVPIWRSLRRECGPSLAELYESFSSYLLEIIDEIEDKCEELSLDNQLVLVESTYRYLYSDICDIVDATSEGFFLLAKRLSGEDFNNFICAASTLRAEFFIIMAK